MHALDLELTHVRDVEDTAVGAHGAMLGDHAVVLHRHLPAGERDHARAQRHVPLEKRSPLKRLRHSDDANQNVSADARANAKWGRPGHSPLNARDGQGGWTGSLGQLRRRPYEGKRFVADCVDS